MMYTEFMTYAFMVYIIGININTAIRTRADDPMLQTFVWTILTWVCFSAVFGVWLAAQMVYFHWTS